MQTIDIYRGDQKLISINPDDSSSQKKAIMGENALQLTFELNHYVDFKLNDWCTVFGEIYKINAIPKGVKNSRFNYEYSFTMDVEGADLAKALFLFLGSDNSLKEGSFSLMANASTFLDLIIENANRISGGWTVGQVINTPYKNLTFAGENCYNALGRIATEFETEFLIEGKKVSLTKVSRDTGYSFRQGKGKGLYNITSDKVDNSSVVTRLYAYGAEKNLPADYRNYSTRLKMPVGTPFVEKNVDKYEVIESMQFFEDIYPQRTGKVTSVNAANIYKFIDADIDFNINNQLLPGLTAKVVFNTGQLAGYQFDISKFNNGTKEFTILKNSQEKALDIPSTLLKPAIGDQYVFVDIKMPQTYIDAAEAALKAKALTLLDDISEPQARYNITLDPVYFRIKKIIPAIGDLVWISDSEMSFSRKIRITSIARNIVNEYNFSLELSDVVSVGTITRILNSQSNTERDVNGVEKALENKAILNNNVIGDLNIRQGSIIFSLADLPTTSTETGFSHLLIENATGKIFRKI